MTIENGEITAISEEELYVMFLEDVLMQRAFGNSFRNFKYRWMMIGVDIHG